MKRKKILRLSTNFNMVQMTDGFAIFENLARLSLTELWYNQHFTNCLVPFPHVKDYLEQISESKLEVVCL